MQDLPAWLRVPLFLLGTLFIHVVFFVPGGIAGPVARLRERRSGRRSTGEGGSPPGRVVEQLRDQVAAGVGGSGPRDGV